MGWGDELMAAGCAEELSLKVGQPITILDIQGFPRWSVIWENNPYIYRPQHKKDITEHTLVNAPGCRPYLSSLSKEGGSVFTDWRARDHIGHIFFSKEEKEYIEAYRRNFGNFYFIEPNISPISNINKKWGFDKWQKLYNKLIKLGIRCVQAEYTGAIMLDSIQKVKTNSFRECCVVLAASKGALTSEGGISHACGVLGIPATVFFGGHVSPETTGYENHINVYPKDEQSPCGKWLPCDHCKKISDSVSEYDMLCAFLKMIQW